MSFDLVDFEKDVVEASHEKPVLVDFWAPWCGPCRMLSPVLERLAQDHAGAWKLVKVNSDEHQELSARYGVRGIPNVKLFVDGLVVDEFTGALPEHAILQWLETAVPTETTKLVENARSELAAGEGIRARRILEDALSRDETNAAARILLAKLKVFDDPEGALELVEGIDPPSGGDAQLAEAVELIAGVLSMPDDGEHGLPEGPGKSAYVEALAALRDHDYETAIAELLDVLLKDRFYADDAARKLGLALFTLLGPEHPVTLAKRKMFNMYLY